MAKDKYVAYVGTYTHGMSEGIYVYDVDPDTGILTQKDVTPINNPSNLCVAHNGKFLYSIADEGVAAFSINDDGSLTKINQEWIGGMRGCHVRTDSQDRYLFVAGYHDGRITVMKINDDGSVGKVTDGIFHQGIGKSVAEKRLDPHITSVELTPAERFLCAVDCGLHQVKVYRINYETGKLSLVDILRCEIDSGPRNIKFSSDGKYAYVITELSNEIFVYSFSHDAKNNPVFELIQTQPLLHKGDDEISSGTNIRISDDGKYVFASVDGTNAIVMYTRDTESGMIHHLKTTCISGDYPKAFAVLPGGKYYVSLNHDTDEIRCFTIDYENGHNLMINPPISIQKPNCITIHKLG